MSTETKNRHLRRTPEEVRERIANLDGHDPQVFQRWAALEHYEDPDPEMDVRDRARGFCGGIIALADDNADWAVAHMREYAWLMERDDVTAEMDRAREERGAGWPEVWAFAIHLDRLTSTRWAEGVVRTPEIAEWAAGL